MTVHIVGSINMDLVAFSDRFPRPGETLRGNSFERHPGGKGANQAIAAARAGAVAVMVGAVGQDAFGNYMKEILAACGVDTGRIKTVAINTGVALIMVANGENQIVVMPGANDHIDPARIPKLGLKAGDVCLAQAEINLDAVRAAFELARARRAVTVFNPAPALPEARALFPLADVLVVNETECALFAGCEFDPANPAASLRQAARAFDLAPGQILIVTLGAAGVRSLVSDRIVNAPGHVVEAVDTTGAGDCFCGYLAAGLSRGESIEAALREANAAAALAVQAKGAASSIPEREAVLNFLKILS